MAIFSADVAFGMLTRRRQRRRLRRFKKQRKKEGYKMRVGGWGV